MELPFQLVDPDTKEDIISKANTPGELWLRGPSTFKVSYVFTYKIFLQILVYEQQTYPNLFTFEDDLQTNKHCYG